MKEDLSLLGGVFSLFLRMLSDAPQCVLSAFSQGRVFILPHMLKPEIAFLLTFLVITHEMSGNAIISLDEVAILYGKCSEYCQNGKCPFCYN